MTDSHRTAETIGEGFAYFAWHRLVWPGITSGECRCKRSFVCYYLWTEGKR